jgi:hypothetical protein
MSSMRWGWNFGDSILLSSASVAVVAVGILACLGPRPARGQREVGGSGDGELVGPLLGHASASGTDFSGRELLQFTAPQTSRNSHTSAAAPWGRSLVRLLPTPEELPLSRIPRRFDARFATGMSPPRRCSRFIYACKSFFRLALPLWLATLLGSWDLLMSAQLFDNSMNAFVENFEASGHQWWWEMSVDCTSSDMAPQPSCGNASRGNVPALKACCLATPGCAGYVFG